MRRSRLAFVLLVAGCFSEPANPSGCFDGEAACDCRPDGTCIDGHECIASIDKCVPTGCTPGSESCTCVDGDCLSAFVCDGGVCVPPSGATTGGDPSVASSISDTIADTGPDATMTMTSASSDPSGSDPTIPPDDTGATDMTSPMTDATSSDPTDASSASMSMSDSDTSTRLCPTCIGTAARADGPCTGAYNSCATDAAPGGCVEVMECFLDFGANCCAIAMTPNAISFWNDLVGCAEDNLCDETCGANC